MERICSTCGKPIYAGMTNDEGSFYVHEGKCFNKFMNKRYGKHQWMRIGCNSLGDGRGGYYLCTDYENEIRGFSPTGIYYTEWDDNETIATINLMVEKIKEGIDSVAEEAARITRSIKEVNDAYSKT